MRVSTYQWTTDDDEIALDAITVGIGSDAQALAAVGIEPEEPTASIYWPDWITQGDMVKAAMEGPYSVPEALERAELLCALWAYERGGNQPAAPIRLARRLGQAVGNRGAGLRRGSEHPVDTDGSYAWMEALRVLAKAPHDGAGRGPPTGISLQSFKEGAGDATRSSSEGDGR